MARLRLGVDIGGTFTDHVLFDEGSGAVEAIKTPSTPDDLSRCVLDGVRRFGRRAGGIAGLDLIAHGTTVNTNAILERRGARCGLIATRGFRDILEIGRQGRPDFYNWFVDRPTPLVPRHLRLEVNERIDTNGKVRVPLDEADVLKAVERFRDADVQSVAVSLINAFANPVHERRIREILEDALNGAYLSMSSELCPEFREFERTSTAAAAAYVGPLFQRYVERLAGLIDTEVDPSPRLYIMQSSGGMVSAVTAVTRPHVTIESGPAAGVIATAELGRRLGFGNLISFDMGGTTAKACLVRDGTPEMVNMLEVGGEASGFFGLRITGLPIKAPSIDLVECSAGGGSIAWVDVAGLLKVGPESAGAVPGPACYETGGIRPTVTDAHVALGRIGAETLLGGEMEIRPDLATQVIQSELASRIDLPVDEAAQGVLDVVNAEMVRILRVVSVTRGFDPRQFSLVAYGGAGPLHAGDLAEELGIERIVVPPNPGVFSAMGLLASDVEVTASVTRRTRASPDNMDAIRGGLAEVERECTARLDRERIPESDRSLLWLLEMRYVRQNFELEVAVPGGMVSSESLARVLTAFHEAHQRTYGHSDEGDPAEIVNFKVRGIGQVKRPRLRKVAAGAADPGDAHTGARPVYFRGSGWTDCPNYDRARLLAGNHVTGPAVINAFDSTALLRPGQTATVGAFGDLIITRG